MINLVNDLTISLEMIVFDLKEKSIEFRFVTRPTIGTIVQNQEEKDKMYSLSFSFLDESERAVVRALKDMSIPDIKIWFMEQFTSWLADKTAFVNPKLFYIFTLIDDIGVK